mgnify:CR=1 FL=1
MKPVTDKLASLIAALKGKKPSVIIATIVVFILGVLGVTTRLPSTSTPLAPRKDNKVQF